MTATDQNFAMWAGDTKTLAVTVTDDAGAPADLSGAAVRWRLAREENAPALVSKETGSGITITDAPAGRFEVALAASDTGALSGDYVHEAEVTDAAGNVSTVTRGRIAIRKGLVA